MYPEGGPVSASQLAVVVNQLNSRIRNRGVSAWEIINQRDQFTGEQLALDDLKLSEEQMEIRVANQGASAKNKSRGRPPATKACIQKGSLVYIKSEGSKNSSRERYLVVDVDDEHCVVQKFVKSQLRSKRYHLKLTEVYPVCPEPIVIPGEIRGIEDPYDESEQYGYEPNSQIEYINPTGFSNDIVVPRNSTDVDYGTSSNLALDNVHVTPVSSNINDPAQYQSVDDTALSIPERVEDCSVIDVYCNIDSTGNSSHVEPVAAMDSSSKPSVRPKRHVGKPKWMEDYVVD